MNWKTEHARMFEVTVMKNKSVVCVFGHKNVTTLTECDSLCLLLMYIIVSIFPLTQNVCDRRKMKKIEKPKYQ